MAMDEFPVGKLPTEQTVVCVCSTTGQVSHCLVLGYTQRDKVTGA